MVSSILHRASGIGATLGLVILLWWLGALIGGAGSYAVFADWMWADLSQLDWAGAGAIIGSLVKIALRIVLIGVSWSLFAHAVTGMRHFVLDTGAGYELVQNKLWANVCTALGVVLTIVFWVLLLA